MEFDLRRPIGAFRDVMVSEAARSFCQAFWRMYCQTFSTGFSFGARDGREIGMMLSDMLRFAVASSTIHDEYGIGHPFDMATDIVGMV